jgi:hypothetical protein
LLSFRQLEPHTALDYDIQYFQRIFPI